LKYDDTYSGDRCTYNLRLILVRVFLTEYCYTIVALAFLCILSVYVVQMQRLFEFLMFVVMELQLELAYRQWWLEARGREAKLIVLDVSIWDGGRILKPLVANVGKDFAYNVYVPFLVLSPNTYEKFSALFSLRPTLIKRFVKLLRSCAECREGYYFVDFFMSPGEQKSLDVDLSGCIKNGRGVCITLRCLLVFAVNLCQSSFLNVTCI
jgi:hypothetical protein